MTKELEAIERVTSPGDLPSRLEAAENATVDVEKRLAKTVRIFKYILGSYTYKHIQTLICIIIFLFF